MARVSLNDDVLRGDDEPQEPKRPVEQELPEEKYKLTVLLAADEYEKLEILTGEVLTELNPRRVGKGWKTKVIRALIELADQDPDAAARIVEDITSRQQAEG